MKLFYLLIMDFLSAFGGLTLRKYKNALALAGDRNDR
jgi:hypothetical protein